MNYLWINMGGEFLKIYFNYPDSVPRRVFIRALNLRKRFSYTNEFIHM